MSEEQLKIIRMADVEAQEVKWLWYPYLPAGKITVLQGDPGEGKTTLMLTLAAYLTKGMPLPGNNQVHPPCTVIYQTAEDGLADTIKPRLEKAGADCSRVIVIDDSSTPLSFSDTRIAEAIEKENAKLLILDPLQAFMGQGVDMHRANEVRSSFRSLANVADRTGCAVLAIGHLNKMSGIKGIYRGLGSIDIPAVARSILYVGRANDDDETRYLAHLKSSLAPVGATLCFEINDKISFLGESPLSAEDLLSGKQTMPSATKQDKAIGIIEAALANCPCPCTEIYEKCRAQGISDRTTDKAKWQLGVKSVKRGERWYWSL